MTTRAVGPMAGIGWLKSAINLGRNNPKAIFGGAALLMVVFIGIVLAAGLLSGMVVAMMGESLTATVVGLAMVMLTILVPMGVLLVGYMRLVDAVESGRPAGALDIFGGFSDMGTSIRAIGLMLLVSIIQNVIMFALLAVFAGGFLSWYVQMLQVSLGNVDPSAVMTQLPPGIGVAYLVMGLLGMLFFGVQAVGLGQIVLRDRGVFPALGNGFSGAFKNLLPLLMLMLAYVMSMIVLAIVAFLLVMLVGLLAKLVGLWLAVVIGVPLYLAFVLAMVVVAFGVMYYLWRDVCDGGSVPDDALNA